MSLDFEDGLFYFDCLQVLISSSPDIMNDICFLWSSVFLLYTSELLGSKRLSSESSILNKRDGLS